MISKLKIISLLLITNIFSTSLLTASFRQKIQAQFTTPKAQQFWNKMAQQHAKFTHTGKVILNKIRLHPKKAVLTGLFASRSAYLLKHPEDLDKAARILHALTPEEMEALKIKPCTDPELLYVFNTIKKDMGITTDIPLFINYDPNSDYKAALVCDRSFSTPIRFIINVKTLDDGPTAIIYSLAHELGHYLQNTKDPKSYNATTFWRDLRLSKDQLTLEMFKEEVGAEANAAGYLDCQDCLHHVQEHAHTTNSYTHQQGYFDTLDWQPYVERAVEHNWLCPAHQAIRNQPVIRKIQHTLGFSQHKYPLHAYLPQTYDRSGYSAPSTLD